MTIYDAGPLAAGPLCGLLNKSSKISGKIFGAFFVRDFVARKKNLLCKLRSADVPP